MASTLIAILTDPTTVSLLATAVATAAYASYRANENLLKQRDPSTLRHAPSLSDQIVDENARVLEGSMAIAFPMIATVSIVLLFFFLGSVGIVLTALSAVSGFFSVLFLVWPLGESLVRRARAAGMPLRAGGSAEATIVVPLVVTVILSWLLTGHWLPNNIIGVGLCVLFAALCKVPNLKVTVMLFAGLFVYDVFFVFFSERFFGRNVMVEVATTAPTNPASAIATYLNLPITPVKNLALPAKLMVPSRGGHHAILGLGDVILPTVLLVYLLEIDIRNRTAPLSWNYFSRALTAYALGLLASFFCNFTFRVAQPALLYIVPAVLLPTVWLGRQKEQLGTLWTGPSRSSTLEEGDMENGSWRSGESTTLIARKDEETTSLMA